MLQQHSYGSPVMPLLMGFTPQTPIEIEVDYERFRYDGIMQISEYDMRTVGTKSLKISTTKKSTGNSTKQDKKNEIDDSKTVK